MSNDLRSFRLVFLREVGSILHQRRMIIFAIGFGIVIPLFAGVGFVGLAVRLSNHNQVGIGSVGYYRASVHVTDLEEMVQSILVWLGIFPILFSAQFAALSFAGERERHSLAALLATPVPLGVLVAAKLIASLLPALVTVVAAYAVYTSSVIADVPQVSAWLPLGTVVAAALFLFSLSILVNGAALLVSTRAATVAGATTTVTFISLPVSVATVIFGITIATLGPLAVAIIAVAMGLVSLFIIWIGTVTWRRGEILANG